MSGISMKVIFPGQRSIASNDFVILSHADGDRVFEGIADTVELLDAETVIAGPED
jgi:hypothetical protein